jgi:hypothetical protein
VNNPIVSVEDAGRGRGINFSSISLMLSNWKRKHLRANIERIVTKIEACDKNLHDWAMYVKISKIIEARFLDMYLGNMPARSIPYGSGLS